jgi:subtilase family serine protease
VVASHAEAQVVTGGPQPCTAAGTSNTADKIASAYDFSPLYQAGDEGAGQTIAILELEPNLTSDISRYQNCYGTNTSVKYIQVDGFNAAGAGTGEAALDIEQAIGLAPQAAIEVYQAPNTNQNLIDDYTAIINDSSVDVISTSWGSCEVAGSTLSQTENTLFMQAAAEGKSVFAASGDSGSEDCATPTKPNTSLAVDDPASQPFVTGVGGTNLPDYTHPASQTVWNDGPLTAGGSGGASGGGISSSWTMPSYQSGAPSSLNVISANSKGSTCHAPAGSDCREVPDVAANAEVSSPDGYPMFYNGGWTMFGGTSAGAPLWAAYTALVNSSTACHGVGIGFANPLLYQAAAAGYSSDFYDTTSGNNNPGHSGLYPAGSGYDMATGLGSPVGAVLAPALCNDADVVSVTNPGNQQTVFDVQPALQILASDNQHRVLSYTATGLPTGLTINPSTGAITGTATKAGSYSVTVTATDGNASGSTTFSWTVTSGGASCTPANPNVMVNPTFASGRTGWVAGPNVIASNAGTESGFPDGDTGFAWLDGYSTPHTDTLSQTVTLPLGCAYQLTYEQAIDTTEPGSAAVDTLSMQVLASNGTVLYTSTPVSNLNPTMAVGSKPNYQLVTVPLTSSVAGQQTVTLKFTGVETNAGGGTTDFLLDDFALTVSPAT